MATCDELRDRLEGLEALLRADQEELKTASGALKAALVALIDDGHTRLTIPREHPEIGLEFGHTAMSEPEHPALRFSQLPLAFEQFEDGVYVGPYALVHQFVRVGRLAMTLDPIVLALVQNRLDYITRQMGWVMTRTARSPSAA